MAPQPYAPRGHSPLSPELAEEGSVFLLTVGSSMVPVGLAPGTP